MTGGLRCLGSHSTNDRERSSTLTTSITTRVVKTLNKRSSTFVRSPRNCIRHKKPPDKREPLNQMETMDKTKTKTT